MAGGERCVVACGKGRVRGREHETEQKRRRKIEGEGGVSMKENER